MADNILKKQLGCISEDFLRGVFGGVGKPVITTPPEVGTGFAAAVIGTSALDNWKSPVVLERDGDNWTLPSGKSSNFFRVRVTKGP